MNRAILHLVLVLGAVGSAWPAWSDSDRAREREQRKEERRERRLERADDSDKGVRIPVSEGMRLEIDITNGDIEIRGWDDPSIHVKGRSGDVDEVDIEVEDDVVRVAGSRIGVGRLRLPFSGGNVDLEVDVPRWMAIQARTVSGEIEAKDVGGRLALHAGNGGIKVEGPVEEALLEVMNANIEFKGKNSRVDARAVNGRIDLEGVAGEVIANSMTGSIKVEAGRVSRVDLRTLSGPIELEADLEPEARVHLKTYNGDVRLKVPGDTSAEFDIQSFSGRVDNELPSTSVSSWRGGPGQRLDFVAGDGSGRVTVESFSGDVEIEDRD